MLTLLEKLTSTRRDDILDGLSDIYADRNTPPQGQILSYVLELLQFSDADVREEAVKAIGLHWQCTEAFPILLRVC
jgi:hypothetical protein